MIVFWDWFFRILCFSVFGGFAGMLLFLPRFDFLKPRPLAESSWLRWGWEWASEILQSLVKLTIVFMLIYTAFSFLLTRSTFRQKREGTLIVCPTCGNDYHPKP